MARCAQPGCWDRDDSNVCWHPRRLNSTAAIGKNPAGGAEIVTVPAGATLCLQSTRNPDCAATAPVRPASPQGYYWVYWNNGSTVYTGWLHGGAIGGAVGAACTGPAQDDWTCGGTPTSTHCLQTVGCADRNEYRQTTREGYLRYAPVSTAYYYVGQGANVQYKGYSSGGGGYVCIVVTSNGKYCPDGTVGWIEPGAI